MEEQSQEEIEAQMKIEKKPLIDTSATKIEDPCEKVAAPSSNGDYVNDNSIEEQAREKMGAQTVAKTQLKDENKFSNERTKISEPCGKSPRYQRSSVHVRMTPCKKVPEPSYNRENDYGEPKSTLKMEYIKMEPIYHRFSGEYSDSINDKPMEKEVQEETRARMEVHRELIRERMRDVLENSAKKVIRYDDHDDAERIILATSNQHRFSGKFDETPEYKSFSGEYANYHYEILTPNSKYNQNIIKPANIQMINDQQEKVPTDTYGQIIYGNRCIHYIRITYDTKPSDVYKLINQFWNMAPPILAVSLIGQGDLKSSVNKAASEKIFESMVKILSTPRICLISSGKYKLNPRLMSCASVDSSFMHLGIAHFGSLDIKDYLIASKPGSSIRDAPESESLDPCHTHVLLIDDGKDTNGVEIDFRANFEIFLSETTHLENQKFTYRKTTSLDPRKDNGPLTQIVSFFMGVEDEYTSRLLEKTAGYHTTLFVKQYIEREASSRMNRMRNRTEIEGTEDIDKLFLEAMVKTEYTVMLYILWNQGEEFWNILPFSIEEESDFSNIIYLVLALNRPDFLKTLPDSLLYNAFEQFTLEDLRFLYWYRVYGCPKNERTSVLKHFIRFVESSRNIENSNIGEDNRDNEESGGDEFAYGKTRVGFIEHFCKITGISGNFSKLSMQTIKHTIVNLQKAVFRSGSVLIKCDKLFEQTTSGLLLWAVLNGMEDMALFLLDFVTQQCATALFVGALTEIISLHEKLPEGLREIYADMKMKFEKVAIGIVERGYQVNSKATEDLLLREIDFMEPYTCVDLAVETRQLLFISHNGVQTLFNNFWRGPWKYEFTFVGFIFTSMCPFYLSSFEYRGENQLHELSEILGQNIYTRKNWAILWPKCKSQEQSIKQRSTKMDKTESCCDKLGEFTYKVYLYFKTPKVKFYWHLVSFIVFLGLMSYSVLEETKTTNIRTIDWILLAFIISMTTHEIKQIVESRSLNWKKKIKLYFNSFVNIIDVLAISLFYIGFVLKTFSSLKEYGELVLAIDTYIWIVRSLRVFYFFPVMGPYLLMIETMVKDMMKFLVILFVFTVAHGVCFTAIMKPQARSWNMLRDIIYHPYYNIYGELFFQDATDTKTIFGTEKRNEYASTLGLISLGIYILIANVLLLNLLIAIFGNTYEEVNKNAHQVWAYQRYLLAVEYAQRSCLAPPFSILGHFYLLIRWCWSSHKSKKTTSGFLFKRKLDDNRNIVINDFESKMKYRNDVFERKPEKKEDVTVCYKSNKSENFDPRTCMTSFHV